ncbi:MAG TPA: DinB family protein [Fimbriimonadaceae bacterium]|nr:DinB family protein [Fimbriimonadaceae bacterium]
MDQQILTDTLKYGFRISHTEEGWIEPLLDAVNGVDFETAKWKPAPKVASIWEIVAHAIPYTESRLCDFTGATKEEEPDWPEIADPTPEAWAQLQERARKVVSEFQSVLEAASGEEIAGPKPGKKTPRAERLMDIVVHDAYHAGQIVKLKQAYKSRAALAHA